MRVPLKKQFREGESAMRIFYIIFLIAVVIVAVVFAGQNSAPVTVAFLGWSANSSMSLVLVITFAVGILLGMLLLLPSVWKRTRALSAHKKKLRETENQLKNAGSIPEVKAPASDEIVADAPPAQDESQAGDVKKP
jgi:uncharacterized membrane protein YciS (DUF1049 family)